MGRKEFYERLEELSWIRKKLIYTDQHLNDQKNLEKPDLNKLKPGLAK